MNGDAAAQAPLPSPVARPVAAGDVTFALLCAEILRRHPSAVRIKKPHVAIGNLERILGAALEISSRKGFHSTTTRDLAEACGLSMGAIYNHVESKETLLRMILGAVGYAVDIAVAPFDEGEAEDPRRRLHGLIRRHVLVTEVLQRWFYFAFLEVKAFDREARTIAITQEMGTEALFAQAIASGAQAGLFHAPDPEVTAGLIKPLLQDWYLKRWKFRQRGITADHYVALVIDFTDRALAPLR